MRPTHLAFILLDSVRYSYEYGILTQVMMNTLPGVENSGDPEIFLCFEIGKRKEIFYDDHDSSEN